MVALLNFTVGMWLMFFVFLLNFLNIQHLNLNFTIDKEHKKQLLFLDVLNTRSDRSIASVYRKSTFTLLLQNYNSFLLFTYKKNLTETLIDRASRLSNTWDGFHLNFKKLKVILQKNEYPPKLIDESINKYLSKRIMKKPSETESSKTKEYIWYFKLLFKVKFSTFTENKLQKFKSSFVKSFVSSTFKLASLFQLEIRFHMI